MRQHKSMELKGQILEQFGKEYETLINSDNNEIKITQLVKETIIKQLTLSNVDVTNIEPGNITVSDGKVYLDWFEESK